MENIDKENIIQRKIPNTKFWVKGIKKSDETWDLYMIETETNNEELIRENITTKSLNIFLDTTLKIEPEKDNKFMEELKNNEIAPKFDLASKVWWIIIIVLVILIGRWIWNSGYRSSEIDNMTDKEFNERYGEPRWQEMREW